MTDSTQNESLLIKKIRQGNEYAFEITFLKYYEPLCKYAWKYVRSKELAKELVQDVFADIWEYRQQLNQEGHLRGFLFTATRNKALDHIKHKKVTEKHAEKIKSLRNEDLYSVLYREAPDTGLLVYNVRKAIDELPPKARRVFLLNREEGLTYKEIAAYLSITIKTVESQISRVLKILRARLSHLSLPVLMLLVQYFKF